MIDASPHLMVETELEMLPYLNIAAEWFRQQTVAQLP